MLRERRVTSLSNDHPENRKRIALSRIRVLETKSNPISKYWRELVTTYKTLRLRKNEQYNDILLRYRYHGSVITKLGKMSFRGGIFWYNAVFTSLISDGKVHLFVDGIHLTATSQLVIWILFRFIFR